MTGAPVAVISGGSSGIGLAVARLLAQRGYRIHLLARDEARLETAREALAADAAAGVAAHVLDVRDAEACEMLVRQIGREEGRLDWLVTSAGMAEPGLFKDLDLDQHRRQMETNYFGTLHLLRPCVEIMRRQGSGRITLVSSGAAFVGIAGYSGYGPGKSALRVLAETLEVELAGEGIAVSIAFPPDTDTPQLAVENRTKPAVTKAITAGGGVMTAEAVAASIVKGALAGKFMLTPGALMHAFGWFHSLYGPLFRRQQRRLMRRHRQGD